MAPGARSRPAARTRGRVVMAACCDGVDPAGGIFVSFLTCALKYCVSMKPSPQCPRFA